MEEKWKEIEPNLWKPENPEDFIIGNLKRTEEKVGKYESKCYFLETPEGITAIFGSKVLDDKMKFIELGERIKIVFKGTVKGENETYKDYKILTPE